SMLWMTDRLGLCGSALYDKHTQTLCVADVHLGFEAAAQSQGILIPLQPIIDELTNLITHIKQTYGLKRFIINGDIKHTHGTLLPEEKKAIALLQRLTTDMFIECICIKGNHDIFLPIKTVDEYRIDNVIYTHGDKPIQKDTS